MEQKINITLNEDYKQFKKDFNCELNGKLIIISGINGSGKSQLMEIIKGKDSLRSKNIISKIKVNDIVINKDLITKRSFKDNTNITNITMPSPKNNNWDKEEAWKNFTNSDLWVNKTEEYSKSKQLVEDILKKNNYKGIVNRFDKDRDIIKKDFIDILPEDFLWQKNDIFSNKINEIFYEFACKRHDLKAKLGEEQGGFNNAQFIKNAPWTKLNFLFKKMNIKYRFKQDYEFKTPNLTETPSIYPIFKNGELNFEEPRNLSDLSDGEKSIISLTFALLNHTRCLTEKIILLDEFDNTLNPSLIEVLYSILEEYFIKNNVMVILTTHSPVTISLAPDYARHYEIFKQENESPKIIKVQKHQYTELEIANKNFYDRINNQENRIKELENLKAQLEGEKLLFVEDKYTQIYKLAWLKINEINVSIDSVEVEFEKNSKFKIYSKGGKDILQGFLSMPYIDEFNGKFILGLFDFDDAYKCYEKLLDKRLNDGNKTKQWEKSKGTTETGLYSTRTDYDNISALMLPVPEHRKEIANTESSIRKLEVELLFSDEAIKKAYGENEFAEEIIIGSYKIPKIKNKENFWKKLIDFTKEDFEHFIPLFKRINELLNIEEEK